jgi:hypothetical protein
MTSLDILQLSQIGFEFEFFSKLSNEKIAKEIGKLLKKKVIIPYQLKDLDNWYVPAKPKEKPDRKKWILTPDFSGGNEMKELVTGPLLYNEARITLINILNWISDNGWTTEKTGLHLNISFLPMKQQFEKISILNLDRLKLALDIDENLIYKYFPNRKFNTYARSVKTIKPNNPYVITDNIKFINPENFHVPNTKYFGINFLKQEKNYLEFRYLGGENYNKKIDKILELQDNWVLTLYNTLKYPQYTEENLFQLSKILKNHKKILESTFSLEKLAYNYPEIVITIDMKFDKEIIKSFWGNIKDRIYDLLINANIKEGHINYDSEMGQIQIKDAKLSNCHNISKYEILNSKISGFLNNCMFIDCEINNSHIENCQIQQGNLINNCKVITSPIQYNNKLVKCYIDNKENLINGTLDECIIRSGEPSQLAILNNCIKVEN